MEVSMTDLKCMARLLECDAMIIRKYSHNSRELDKARQSSKLAMKLIKLIENGK